jgi:predicted Zn-dependent protease
VLAVTAYAEQRELKPGFNLFSKEQDVQLGREAAQQIEQKVRVVRDSQLNDYVARLGKALVSHPSADQYPYTFKVVADQNINAFALPGGPSYVHTGLILAAENEAQLVGVMAHEIAHVALRHGTNQASKAQIIQLPLILGGAMIGGDSILGQLAQLGIGIGANSVLLKFSRDAERDADLLGARMMAAAGYNPIEMARFFEKLEATGGNRTIQFFSSHPNPGNRVKAVQEELQYLPQRSYNAGTGQFARMKNQAQRAAASAPAPQSGGVAGQPRVETMPDVRPSQSYLTYQGNTVSFMYPDNWQVFEGTDSITVAPPDAVHNGAVGFGLVAGIAQMDRRASLGDRTEQFLRSLEQSQQGMRRSQAPRSQNINGQPALVTVYSSTSPYVGKTESDTVVTMDHPQGLFYMVLATPKTEYSRMRSVFNRILTSVNINR